MKTGMRVSILPASEAQENSLFDNETGTIVRYHDDQYTQYCSLVKLDTEGLSADRGNKAWIRNRRLVPFADEVLLR
jgi:hypothetical protein